MCPNLKNPKVAQEFKELVDAVGETVAYAVWAKNEGLAIDRTPGKGAVDSLLPDGVPSKLFSDLLSHFGDDRTLAIQAKVKTFSNGFKTWFGESKVVDENGEPLMIYHGTRTKGITEFDNTKSSVKSVASVNDNEYYFTSNKSVATGYAEDIQLGEGFNGVVGDVIPVFLNLKNPHIVDMNGANFNGKYYTAKVKDLLFNEYEDLEVNGKTEFSSELEIIQAYKDKYGVTKVEDGDYTIEKHVRDDVNQIVEYARNNGNDGVIIKNIKELGDASLGDDYVVFDNTNIKSAVNNDGEFNPKLSNIYHSKPTGRNNDYRVVDDITDKILKGTLSIPTNKQLIRNILFSDSLDVELTPLASELSKSDVQVAFGPVEGSAMQYNAETNEITIDVTKLKTFNGTKDFANTYLHEVLHAYTVKALNNPKGVIETRFANRMKIIFEKAKKANIKGDRYGLTNVHEFVSELMTNKTFREELNKASTMTGTIWQRIVRAIKSLFSDKHEFALTNGTSIVTEKAIRNILQYVKTSNSGELVEDATNDNADVVKALETIRKAKMVYKNRIASLASSADSKIEADNLKRALEDFEKLDEQEVMYRFVTELPLSFSEHAKYLQKCKAVVERCHETNDYTELASIDEVKINKLGRDFISSYGPLLNEINKYYLDFLDGKNIMVRKALSAKGAEFLTPEAVRNSFAASLTTAINLMANATNAYEKVSDALTVKALKEEGIKVNSKTIGGYLANQLVSITRDLNWSERYLQSARSVSDDAVQLMYNLVTNTKSSVTRFGYNNGKKIARLASKAGNLDKLREIDSKGKPTGYLIRDRLYGEARRNYTTFLKQLEFKYGVQLTDYHYDSEAAIHYKREINSWLDKHYERMYTSEYYDIYDNVSTEAANARSDIQRKITAIFNECTDQYGKINLEDLTDEKFQALDDLNAAKKALTKKVNADGSIKSGIELSIAEELTEVNKKIQAGLSYKVDKERFDKELAEKQVQYKNEPEKLEKWKARNSRTVYSQEFWDLLSQIETREYGKNEASKQKYQRLSEYKRELLSIYRNNEFEIGIMPQSAKNIIKDIDAALKAIKRETPKVERNEDLLQFDDVAAIKTTKQYAIDKEYALSRGNEYYNTWYNDNHKTTKSASGVVHEQIASYYTYLVPKDAKFISIEPGSLYSMVDDNSAFLNKNYDRNNPEALQPKLELYDNKAAYDKAMSNAGAKEFYDNMVELMKEANSKIPHLVKRSPYMLPQVSGTTYRSVKSGGLLKGTAQSAIDAVTVQSDDSDFTNEDVLQSVDGKPIRFVPTHYAAPLSDPTLLTADMAGSFIKYVTMAENYKQMLAIAPKAENILSTLGRRMYSKKEGNGKYIVNGTETNAYGKLDDFLNMTIYGEKTKQFKYEVKRKRDNLDGSSTNRVFSWSKMISWFVNKYVVLRLGWNMVSAASGVISAKSLSYVEALSGRFFTKSNYAASVAECGIALPGLLASTGNLLTKNTMAGLMEFFDISMELGETFKDMNRPRIMRAAENIVKPMAVWQAADVAVKLPILLSILRNHKLIDGHFIDRITFINEFSNKHNVSRSDAKKEWKLNNSITLRDAFAFNGDTMQIKDKYKNCITEDDINRIKELIKYLTANIDGMLNPTEKTVLFTNALTRPLFTFRGFMVRNVENMFTKKKTWNPVIRDYDEAQLKAAGKAVWIYLRNAVKRAANEMTRAEASRSILSHQRYALRRTFYQACFVAITYGISQMLISACNDDDDETLYQFFALAFLKSSLEQYAGVRAVVDIADLWKTPMPAMGLVDAIDNIMTSTYGVATNDEEYTQPLQAGPYKGLTRPMKAAIGITPFKNLYELQHPKYKRKWVENQLLK